MTIKHLKSGILVAAIFFIPSWRLFAQSVVVGTGFAIDGAWDGVLWSHYGGELHHMIGTYRGWDAEAFYLAGYNNVNNSAYATKRIRFGQQTTFMVDFTNNSVSASGPASIGGNLTVSGSISGSGLDVSNNIKWGSNPSPWWGYGLLSMSSGWADGSYPTLGSMGGNSGSLIMLQNPHVPFRTDNAAPGYTGRAGLRMAIDQNATTWWDMGVAGDFFHVYRLGSGEFFRITNSGLVGIGTTSPDSKLTVNGTVHSKEVKVDMNIWPDYVFSPEYQLPSLEETKAFIEANNHLPEVPSAKEVEENGVMLGEMNALLLKKIEELTLHLIEQNNNLKNANRDIESLKQEIIDLRKNK